MFEVVKSLDKFEKEEYFVALGYYISEETHHAGIIIKAGKEYWQFHFDSQKIDFSELKLNFYQKITNVIHPSDVPAFISHCKAINSGANPVYGFFFPGSFYDKDGVFFGNKDLGERMTCVGFCLNTLNGFLEDSYIEESDWKFDPDLKPGYLEYFCQKHNLDIEKVKPFWKRISPGQFLASGFFSEIPIKKAQIDNQYSLLKPNMIKMAGYFE